MKIVFPTTSLSNIMDIGAVFTKDVRVELMRANAVKYVTLSGAVVLIYDTLLCFPNELRLVWWTLLRKGSFGRVDVSMRILYLLARYMMIVVCIIVLIMVTPVVRLSTTWCLNATIFVGAADIVLESIASGVVFYRLYELWEFKRRGRQALLSIFVIGKVIVWTFTFYIMAKIDGTIQYIDIDGWRSCATLSAPRLALGVWIPDAMLDVSLVVFFVLNALSRPRLMSQSLVGIIYKDGIQFFLTMICMRTINVVFTAIASPYLFFLGIIFSGSMVTTVACRVLLGLFGATQNSICPELVDYRGEDRILL